MAALDRHNEQAVVRNLRHNTHDYPEGKVPRNIDIDKSRTHLNKALHPPDRGTDATDCSQSIQYYHERLANVYKMNRTDTVRTMEWCITAPADLEPGKEMEFFKSTYDYLNSLYQEKNCIQAICHFDEGVKNANGEIVAGRPHMHYTFVVTKEIDTKADYDKKLASINTKYDGIRNSKEYQEDAKVRESTERNYKKAIKRLENSPKYKYPEKLDFQSIDKNHLQSFHPNFQRWINDNGPACTVYTNQTGANKSVQQLKDETRKKEILHQQERIRELEETLKKEQIQNQTLSHKLDQVHAETEKLFQELSAEKEVTTSLKKDLAVERERTTQIEKELSAEKTKSQQLENQVQQKQVELDQAKAVTQVQQEQSQEWGSTAGWGTQTKTEEIVWNQ